MTRVVAVEDAAAAARFLELPAELNRDDPRFHDGSRFAAEADLAGTSAFLRYGAMSAFLRLDGERAVGRLAAFTNPRLVDGAGRPIGQVGYFESVEDGTVAGELFAAASGWLRGRGAAQMVGPMAGGAHRAHRIMAAGFDRTPFFLEPRGRRCYVELFEAAGFARIHSWYGYDWTPAELGLLLERVGPIAARAEQDGRYRIERVDPRRPGLFPRLHALLDSVWHGHVGYAPLDLEEMVEGFTPLMAMMDDDCLAVGVEAATGRDVGFAFIVPDHIDAVRALGHDRERWARWLAETSRARPRRIVLHTVAVAPDARGTGLAAWLIRDLTAGAVSRGYERAVVALVDETFTLFGRVASPTREHALYARSLW
jgi:GNAT superfamily N-acetyltransferase